MPSAQIRSTDLGRFDRIIARAEKETSRSSTDAVLWAATNFVESARARSKPPPGKRSQVAKGEKHHKVEPNPEHAGVARRDKGGRFTSKGAPKKFRIVKLAQEGKKPVYVYTNDPKDKRRRIARQGLGWASWAFLLPKFSRKKAPGAPGIKTRATRATKVNKKISTLSPTITITNRLGYLLLDNPSLVNESLRASSNKLQKLLDNRAKKIGSRFF